MSDRDHNARWEIRHTDCLRGMRELPAGSVDVVICDPPYGINFAGRAWDRPQTSSGKRSSESRGRRYQDWCEQWARECLRVLKPGGHLASFGSPRTFHRLASAFEDAGLQLRDTLMWLYGQGYPKTRNLTGAWAGWGTGLKPAYEPIVLARRPPDGPVAASVARHGTGALHIDACRVADRRWPPNLLLSHHPDCAETCCAGDCPIDALGDRARFFYCAKPNRHERDTGCEHLPRRTPQTFKIGRQDALKAERVGALNVHPTVKPIELMGWLVRLLTRPGGLVLDPFAGSGSTGAAAVLEGARFLGFEQDPEYAQIARARIGHHAAGESPADASRRACASDSRSLTRPTNTGLDPSGTSSCDGRSRGARGPHQPRAARRRANAPGPATKDVTSMQSNGNPQKPASTPTADPPEITAVPQGTEATTTTEPKSKPPAGKAPRASRRAAKTAPVAAKKPAATTSRTSRAAKKPARQAKPAPAIAKIGGPREGSTMWAILKVLGTAKEPLGAKDIYAQIAKRKLAHGLKGKTPDQTVAAALAVAAKQGRYVERAAPGKFQLRKEQP